jgi:hypothetical protein
VRDRVPLPARFYSEGAPVLARNRDRVLKSTKADGVEHEHIIPLEILEDCVFRNDLNGHSEMT